eukprot:365535-Chlamydomonas_euryale.AAC.66
MKLSQSSIGIDARSAAKLSASCVRLNSASAADASARTAAGCRLLAPSVSAMSTSGIQPGQSYGLDMRNARRPRTAPCFRSSMAPASAAGVAAPRRPPAPSSSRALFTVCTRSACASMSGMPLTMPASVAAAAMRTSAFVSSSRPTTAACSADSCGPCSRKQRRNQKYCANSSPLARALHTCESVAADTAATTASTSHGRSGRCLSCASAMVDSSASFCSCGPRSSCMRKRCGSSCSSHGRRRPGSTALRPRDTSCRPMPSTDSDSAGSSASPKPDATGGS